MLVQIAELKRGAEIIVCTPGRMIDMLGANSGMSSPRTHPLPPHHTPVVLIGCRLFESNLLRSFA